MKITFEDIYTAYQKCRLHKKFSKQQALFELHLGKNITNLAHEIDSKSYKIRPHHYFIVRHPKPREIFSANFRDRVIHHYLISKLQPYWEKKFSHSSFACRTGKGTFNAIKAFQKKVHLVSQGGTQQVYVLQLDINSFFSSIHRPTLVSLLTKHIFNQHLKWLTELCFLHDPRIHVKNFVPAQIQALIPKQKSWFSQPPEYGIPIGNLTSQFGANVYLNDLDHYIVRTLKPNAYIRYVDDITFIDKDKSKLENIIHITTKWLLENRKMHFNQSKTKLTPLAYGIRFIGYKIIQTRAKHDEGHSTKILIPNNKKYEFIKQLRFIDKTNFTNFLTPHPLDVKESFRNGVYLLSALNSRLGHLKFAKTYEFRKKSLQKIRNKNLRNKKKYSIIINRKTKKYGNSK